MPRTDQSPDPAVRAHIDRIGIDTFATRYELNRRTAERIYSGAKPCPPRLLETIQYLEVRHHG